MNDDDPTRDDLWADFLDPNVDGGPSGASELTESERALLERTHASLAGPTMWDGPSSSARSTLLALAAAESPVPTVDPAAADEPGGVTSLADHRERRSSRNRWVAVAAAGAAAAVLAAALVVPRGDDQPSLDYALAAGDFAPDAGGRVGVEATGSGFAITLQTNALPAAEPDTYYSGWVMPEGAMSDGAMGDDVMDSSAMDDRDMVPVGSFHLRDGNGPIILWSGVDLAEYPIFMVTVQQEGEPPAPTGVVALQGAISD